MAQRSHFAPPPTTARHPPEKRVEVQVLSSACVPIVRIVRRTGDPLSAESRVRAAIPKAAASRPGADERWGLFGSPIRGTAGSASPTTTCEWTRLFSALLSSCSRSRSGRGPRSRSRSSSDASVSTAPSEPLEAARRSSRATPRAACGGSSRAREWGRWRRVRALQRLEKAHHPPVPRLIRPVLARPRSR